MNRPDCRQPDACKAKSPTTQCKACIAAARWSDPERKAAMVAKVRATKAQRQRPPFKNELRVRRAVLLATAFGLNKAGKMMGMDPKKISLWRRRLEEIEGRKFDRLPPTPPKLSVEQAREVRALLKAGEKHEYLAAVYGVSASTIYRIATGKAYRELAAEDDRAAWGSLGSRRSA